jgi:CubicO group peptidase (beta-lactamase class C family)
MPQRTPRTLLLAALAAGAPPAPASAQPPSPAAPLDSAALVDTLRAEMRETHAPGAALAVVVGDRVVFARGFGVTSVEGGPPVDAATLFRIGSTTKMFTGMTALRLAAAGRLSLDRPVGAVARGLAPALASVTLHQLLSHTGGLVNAAAGDGPHDPAALGERVRRWGVEQRFADPGAVYSYSGPGYWLAGYAIEQAAGRWFADVVDEQVLAPVGMARSTFRPLEAFTFPTAQDHRVGADGVARVLRPFPDDVTTWASGSLFSSASELARFAVALLNEGRVDGAQALPAPAVRAMFEPRAPVPGGACSYGYGLSLCDEGGVRVASHAGFRGGSGSIVTIVPAHRVAVVVLANRNGGIFRRTEQTALRLLVPALARAGSAAAPTPPPRAPTAFDARARRLLAGAYANGADTLRLADRAGRLVYRYGADESAAGPGASADEIVVRSASGEPEQQFLLLRGPDGAVRFLHDGLSAFRRVQ